jgi:hypothetical protein
MAAEPKGRGHPECYAQALCECHGPVNREHVLTESILELVDRRNGQPSNSVLVRGLAFQRPGVLERKGVKSLVGKVLCEGHNSFLGQRIDPAGLGMFKAMDSLNETAGHPSAAEEEFRVEGDDLERWMLKTFVGGLFSGNFLVGPGKTTKGNYPPRDWLEILFRGAEFPDAVGLYWLIGTPGRVLTANEEVLQLEPICAQGSEVISGMRVRFFGFDFVLAMDRILPGGSGLFENVAYHPAGLRVEGSDTRIKLDWKDGPKSSEIVVRLCR